MVLRGVIVLLQGCGVVMVKILSAVRPWKHGLGWVRIGEWVLHDEALQSEAWVRVSVSLAQCVRQAVNVWPPVTRGGPVFFFFHDIFFF